jgi:signal transduction histidine kinase
MPATEFLKRVVSRIDRVDRKSLEGYVLDLAAENKFLSDSLDRIPIGIMVLNLFRDILFLNRRMTQLFNVPDSIRAKPALPQVIQDPELQELIENALREQRELFRKEVDVLLPRPMVLQLTLTYEKAKEETWAVLFVSNLTQPESEAREEYKRQNWESMVGLAAGIAHEIGNPLNSLAIHLKLLEKNVQKLSAPVKQKIQASIQVMEDELGRLDRIVHNFLRATRRTPLRFEFVQVNELVSKTAELVKPELKTSKIEVKLNLDSQMPVFLMDPERIRQVILNITKNAIYAMPKGGTLEIRSESKGKLCLIRFRDTGTGIPGEDLPKIFDAYYTKREGGSGLGLMIVAQIIREHGGRIEVASKLNEGSTFTVILPIRKEKLGLPKPEVKVRS